MSRDRQNNLILSIIGILIIIFISLISYMLDDIKTSYEYLNDVIHGLSFLLFVLSFGGGLFMCVVSFIGFVTNQAFMNVLNLD
jgi:amino acid transporter